MTNPLCGGTELDTLANFVADGWACLAVLATDKLGNRQVSRPLRICVDKDLDGAECPHKRIASVTDGTPLLVTTTAPHGYVTGDEVKVTGVDMATPVNRRWIIDVTGPTSFTLRGSTQQMPLNVFPPVWTRGPGSGFHHGHVLRMSEPIPTCTGTQIAEPPTTMVDNTACVPWSAYAEGGWRQY